MPVLCFDRLPHARALSQKTSGGVSFEFSGGANFVKLHTYIHPFSTLLLGPSVLLYFGEVGCSMAFVCVVQRGHCLGRGGVGWGKHAFSVQVLMSWFSVLPLVACLVLVFYFRKSEAIYV